MPYAMLCRVAAAVLIGGGLAACDITDRQQGDPSGTALGRATDRALGTNMSGAYPSQRDGTAVNPPGTALERAVDPNVRPSRNPGGPKL